LSSLLKKEEKQVKKKVLFGLIVLTLVALVALPLCAACAPAPPAKDKIVIGAARPISGPLAQIGDYAMGPVMTLWSEEVNARGGIDVAGRKLP